MVLSLLFSLVRPSLLSLDSLPVVRHQLRRRQQVGLVVAEGDQQHAADDDECGRAQHPRRDHFFEHEPREKDVGHKLDGAEGGKERLRREAEGDEVQDVAARKKSDAELPLAEGALKGERRWMDGE